MKKLYIGLILGLVIWGCFKRTEYPPVNITGLMKDYTHVGETLNVYLSAEDAEFDSLSFQVDWGDGKISDWSKFVEYGKMVEMKHVYQSTGICTVKARAKDYHGKISEWTKIQVVGVYPVSKPPVINFVEARETCYVGTQYKLVVKITDPENDSVNCMVEWGDGKVEDWKVVDLPSGKEFVFYHSFATRDVDVFLPVVVKARDCNWWFASETLNVLYYDRPPYLERDAIKFKNTGIDTITDTIMFSKTEYWVAIAEGGASDPDPGDSLLCAEFDWGDGEKWRTSFKNPMKAEITASHYYVEPGTYNVIVRVMNVHGKYSPQACTLKLELVSKFDKVIGEGVLNQPIGLAFFGDSLLVADADEEGGYIYIFENGEYAGRWEGFKRPWDIEVLGDTIFVSDLSDFKVFMLNVKGEIIGEITKGERKLRPRSMSVKDSMLAVVDADAQKLYIFNLHNKEIMDSAVISEINDVEYVDTVIWILKKYAGRGVGKLEKYVNIHDSPDSYINIYNSFSVGLSTTPFAFVIDGNKIYVTDLDEDAVKIYDINKEVRIARWGAGGTAEGLFQNPHGIMVKDGKVYVSDTGNGRIQVFNGL